MRGGVCYGLLVLSFLGGAGLGPRDGEAFSQRRRPAASQRVADLGISGGDALHRERALVAGAPGLRPCCKAHDGTDQRVAAR